MALLKKQYIGFRDSMVLSMINRLHLKMAIKMTTVQKHKHKKTTEYNNPWDPTTSITAYFTQLNQFQVSLGDCGIATSDDKKTMVAGAQMWHSKMFMEDQIVAWETKTAVQQTLVELQTGFTKKCLECKQYSAMMIKQLRFKETLLLVQETPAAEDDGELQAMLFAMLQEQHDKQIAAMTTTNKANMDTMMERMNVLVIGEGGR